MPAHDDGSAKDLQALIGRLARGAERWASTTRLRAGGILCRDRGIVYPFVGTPSVPSPRLTACRRFPIKGVRWDAKKACPSGQ